MPLICCLLLRRHIDFRRFRDADFRHFFRYAYADAADVFAIDAAERQGKTV